MLPRQIATPDAPKNAPKTTMGNSEKLSVEPSFVADPSEDQALQLRSKAWISAFKVATVEASASPSIRSGRKWR
jgi:hypothetical protein